MSTDPRPATTPPEGAPGADEGQDAPVDPVQEGAPATGPEAPVPPVEPVTVDGQ